MGRFGSAKTLLNILEPNPFFPLTFKERKRKIDCSLNACRFVFLAMSQRESKTRKLTEIISQEGMVNWPKRKKNLKARIMFVQ